MAATALWRCGSFRRSHAVLSHQPLSFFTPAVLSVASAATFVEACEQYALAAAASGVSQSTVDTNVEIAQEARANGGEMSRDFVLVEMQMALADDEAVFVTTQWRQVQELTAFGAGASVSGFVEQRCLRFGGAREPPENQVVVGQPTVCQKAYLRVSFFVFSVLPRPPLRLLLVGVGAGQLLSLWRAHLPPCTGNQQRVIHCVELHVSDFRCITTLSPRICRDTCLAELTAGGGRSVGP